MKLDPLNLHIQTPAVIPASGSTRVLGWVLPPLLLLVFGCAGGSSPPRLVPDYPDLDSTVKPVVAAVGTITGIDESRPRMLGVELLVDHMVYGSGAPTMDFGSSVRFAPRSDDLCPGSEIAPAADNTVNVVFHLGDVVLVIMAPPDRMDRVGETFHEQDLYALLYVRWLRGSADDKAQAVYRQGESWSVHLSCKEGEIISTRKLYDSVERTWEPETKNLGGLEADIRDFYTNRRAGERRAALGAGEEGTP